VREPALVPHGVPAGVPHHAFRPSRPGADRFAVRRADGRDRIRPDTYQPLRAYKPAATRAQVEKALQMLNDAERPLITAGGGVINADASDLLVRFAEITGVPVIPTLMGWGAIPDDHPLMAGMAGCRPATATATPRCWRRTS
jgi:tartronate-semialdehyde synthase